MLQGLVQRIQEVLADSSMQDRAAAVAQEVAGYAGVSQAADIALGAVSPWGKLKAAAPLRCG
jgi:UDP:flavonoid glycosyltransferase YjiC (YdhE family)